MKRKPKPTFQLCGEMLKDHRELDLKITQRELASRLGNMNSQFVSNWERGLCMPPAYSMRQILSGLSRPQKLALKKALGTDLANHYWTRYR